MVRKTETVELGGEKITFKKNALHRQLKVPTNKTIGVGNLKKIKKAALGSMVTISSSSREDKRFKVTPLMKKRAILGLNLSGR